ncbi:MAG: hypothetical protein WA085_02900 [Sphingobium sp.]|uniref:hypothetical protein n=1 Tax=Sphingobium sp. CECT 9361 TaxID=2845384 RepID=UPI001E3BAA48|nr:hypothetical protein [Sphingobium sp. CECT 9361]
MSRYLAALYMSSRPTTRDINLTGHYMGQLRTANNRRNRAARNAIERRPAAADILTAAVSATPALKAKSKPSAS